MNKKKLLISVVLVVFLFSVVTFMSFALSVISDFNGRTHFDPSSFSTTSFDNSTPQATAVSVARLNMGKNFHMFDVKDVYLTSDKKYWIVKFDSSPKKIDFIVTIDAKTLMSKVNDGEWRSFDELKALYIAQIQGLGNLCRYPQKVTMDGKEIWKVPFATDFYENGTDRTVKYIYVDVTTGKSKNTLEDFNKAAGTDDWLKLKQVDAVLTKKNWEYPKSKPFRNILRDFYPE